MNFGNRITEIFAAQKVKCPKERCSKGNRLWQPSCQKWEKKKKEFNYLGNEVAENEQLAKKKNDYKYDRCPSFVYQCCA